MLPALPAQIHVPDLTSSAADRGIAAKEAASRGLGLGLVVGAPVVVVVTLVIRDATAATFVIPGVWVLAVAIAVAAFATTMVRAHVDITPRPSTRALLFAGLALIGPLTLHALVQTHLWAPSEYRHFAGPFEFGGPTFASWQHASLVLAGPTHLVFAFLCTLRALRAKPRLVVIGVLTTLSATWCLACYGPFGLLPPAYVAVTCVPLLRLLRRLERA